MELVELWRVIRKRLSMILLITLVATATSGVMSKYVLPKQYASAATLMVIPHNTTQDLLTSMVTGQQLVTTYAQVATSRSVLQSVISGLKLPLSFTQLAHMVSATPVTNTDLLTIQVKSTNPSYSSHVANAVASATVSDIRQVTKQRDLEVVDTAIPVRIPVAPKTKTNVAIALVLGLMVGGGLAFLLEYLDDTLRTEEDIKRVLDLPILTTVPVIELEPDPRSKPRPRRQPSSVRSKVEGRRG